MKAELLVLLGAVTAVGAALRSTWSPCGLSMLSTVTPLAEASRGRRWIATAAWFVVGASLGGATLGAGAAVLAAGVGAMGTTTGAGLGAGAIAAAICLGFDLGWLRPALAHHRRQVNEQWLGRYRSWVYGVTFGYQIGFGLATYIMTAAVYLTVALAALTGEPLVAFALCTLFGFARGLVVLLGYRIRSTAALMDFHRRFDQMREPVRRALIVVVWLVGVFAAVLAWGAAGAVGAVAVTALAAAGAAAVAAARGRLTPGRGPASPHAPTPAAPLDA